MFRRNICSMFYKARVSFQRVEQTAQVVSKNRILLNIATGALASGLGIFLYDFTNKQNINRMDAALERLMSWDSDWDQINVESLPAEAKRVRTILDEVESRQPVKKRHVILVRHCQKATGESPVEGLSKAGVKQAEIVSTVLKSRLSNIPVRVVVSGKSEEANLTATCISNALLKEGSPLTRIESEIFNEGIGATPEPPIAAEVDATDKERLEDAFFCLFRRPLPSKNDNVAEECADILVTHGNVMRHLLCLSLQIDPRAWLRFAVNNGGFIWLEIEGSGRVTARSIGNDSAFPAELLTYT